MSSDTQRVKYLLGQYFRKAITGEELREFWRLLSGLSEEQLAELGADKLWNDPSLHTENDVNWESVYNRLHQEMDNSTLDYNRIITRKSVKWKRLAWAASLLVLIAAGTFVYFLNIGRKAGLQVATSQHAHQFQVLRLPDGTVVTLNQQSRLEYPADFIDKTREVYLYGEAFFEVQHDPSRPFLVHTGNITTRVLGTSFNIKAYGDENDIAVAVSTGKVQVQKKDKTVLGLLTAGDQLIIDRKRENAAIARVDVADIGVWKTPDLYFDNMTVEEAVEVIGRHFNVEIKLENELLGKCRFTARFTGKDASIKQVLDVITILTATSWEREDSTIIRINGKGCNN
jgi:ferric-dicitrate binding protein FerR (iron transport regulator)